MQPGMHWVPFSSQTPFLDSRQLKPHSLIADSVKKHTFWEGPMIESNCIFCLLVLGFPGGSDGKESACSAQDLGSIPGLERSPGEGNEWLPTPELLVLIEMQWDLD